MKQQIIELKEKILLVELPEDYVAVSVFPFKRTLTMWNENGQYITEKLDFDVDEIGKLTDITESQFEQWVEVYTSLENRVRNYTTPAYIEILLKTAKESFFSYLERQGILFSNPLGEFPTKHNTGLEYGMEYISKVEIWEEAQEKVWDINKCYLFEILN